MVEGGGGVMSLVTWQRGEKEEKKKKQDHNLTVPIFGQFESSTHVKKMLHVQFLLEKPLI